VNTERVEGSYVVDDQYRGLLTDREREILADETGVSSEYYARVISRVRSKVEELGNDATILREHHPELYEELCEAVSDELD